MPTARAVLIWAALTLVIAAPMTLASTSPLNGFRPALYTVAAFAGIVALVLLLMQPLLAGGYLPGMRAFRGRRAHRWCGTALAVAIAIHVAGLGWSSPPDMADALLFASPTLFTPFGVVAMWAVLATAVLAALRRRFGLQTWRLVHLSLGGVIVTCSVTHGLLIEGTMETMTKAALSTLVVVAAIKAAIDVLKKRAPGEAR